MPIAVLAVALATCLVPPVDAPVTDPFRMPACPYCAGNRGIEYGPAPGTPVVAAAAGDVTFAGRVAGVRWVVVRHADGLLASYGHLSRIDVRVGATVRAGHRLGATTDRFYLGLRDGDRPVDPTGMLGRWRHRRRLVPVDGTPARPPGPPRLVCPNRVAAR
ncbi:MAG: M23 family metallopeptidase [Acidimicrobiales bacterium]|nr:M23 family metallopeptidase [Acidimicrobiales bacterium]MCB9394685.1 M23 family metallopeptidase [Acidimicrobiaceae bacterium]